MSALSANLQSSPNVDKKSPVPPSRFGSHLRSAGRSLLFVVSASIALFISFETFLSLEHRDIIFELELMDRPQSNENGASSLKSIGYDIVDYYKTPGMRSSFRVEYYYAMLADYVRPARNAGPLNRILWYTFSHNVKTSETARSAVFFDLVVVPLKLCAGYIGTLGSEKNEDGYRGPPGALSANLRSVRQVFRSSWAPGDHAKGTTNALAETNAGTPKTQIASNLEVCRPFFPALLMHMDRHYSEDSAFDVEAKNKRYIEEIAQVDKNFDMMLNKYGVGSIDNLFENLTDISSNISALNQKYVNTINSLCKAQEGATTGVGNGGNRSSDDCHAAVEGLAYVDDLSRTSQDYIKNILKFRSPYKRISLRELVIRYLRVLAFTILVFESARFFRFTLLVGNSGPQGTL